MTHKDIVRNLIAGAEIHDVFSVKKMYSYVNVRGTNFQITEKQRAKIKILIELETTQNDSRRHIYKYKKP